MKKIPGNSRLTLSRETLRVLSKDELGKAAGGSHDCPSVGKGPTCNDSIAQACDASRRPDGNGGCLPAEDSAIICWVEV